MCVLIKASDAKMLFYLFLATIQLGLDFREQPKSEFKLNYQKSKILVSTKDNKIVRKTIAYNQNYKKVF